jgi:hypothetical protein
VKSYQGRSFSAVGQIPCLDFLLDKNPILRFGPLNLGNVTRIALEHLTARLKGEDLNFNIDVPDFVGRNKSVYGNNADEFHPERWLRREEESEDEFTQVSTWVGDPSLTFPSKAPLTNLTFIIASKPA